MDDILLTLHFVGLFMGGASAFGLPVIGAIAGAAPADHVPSVAKAVKPLKRVGHIGLGLLLLTGVAMASAEGIWGSAPFTFWVKLLAVVALFGSIIVAGRQGAKAMAGDEAAAGMVKMLSVTNMILVLVILYMAVVTFG